MARPGTSVARPPEIIDIAIITILPEEYEAVRKQLGNPRRDPGTEEQPNQYAWMLGEIARSEGGHYQVVLAMAASPGNTSGSLATSKTIARWQPRYVLLVGIAGGMAREDLELGDVVVSSIIRAYEYGKVHEGRFEPRPDFQYRVNGSLLRNALSLKTDSWQKGIGRQPGRATAQPKVLAGPIASGDKVIDDVTSEFFAAVAHSFPKLLAVEMEGAGAAAAIEEAQEEGRSVGFLMIRGISDMPPAATGKKQAKQRTSDSRVAGGTKVRDKWKVYAAEAAARFSVHLMANAWPVPPRATVKARPQESKPQESMSARDREAARARYFRYLEAECGEIQLDGLPADEELGSRRLELEKLFVPLHVVRCRINEEGNAAQPSTLPEISRPEATEFNEAKPEKRLFFGELLATTSRVALLAPPGGGKSTMLKRLALAYAFPERHKQIDDRLPKKNWLPLLLRCRELKTRATAPFSEILSALAERAEMKDQQNAFQSLTEAALADRSLLLLVDGLDEITDEGARSTFVQQLHTFIELHPGVSMVVTSREAGFRLVASTVAKLCNCYRLAEFDDKDITRLTVAWHREVVGDRPQVIKEAQELAKSIFQTDRVRRLAGNPLLLTTLLLVRRWVGELPQRRSVLYQKAIEVLLMSWNAAAHEKLETSEALPQLGFLAFIMMEEGLQQISERRLRTILVEARQQMEDIYAYTRIGVDEFIRRVEHRSSLLVQSGHTFEEGRMWPLYEFRHLTFQEYLAAHAVVEGHYPNRQESDNLLGTIQPYLKQHSWKEVIPLAAVLAGRNARPLIEHLTELCERECRHSEIERRHDARWYPGQADPPNLLVQCLIDEVPLPPVLAERAILALARAHNHFLVPMETLARGRYREKIEQILKADLEHNTDDFPALGSAIGGVGHCWWNESLSRGEEGKAVEQLKQQLQSDSPVEQATAALTLMRLSYRGAIRKMRSDDVDELLLKLEPLLKAPQIIVHGAAMWAYAWFASTGAISPQAAKRILPRLFELWMHANPPDMRAVAAYAIAELPLIERKASPLALPTTQLIEWLIKEEQLLDYRRKSAALVIAYYWGQPWADEELRKRIERKGVPNVRTTQALLDVLNPSDRATNKHQPRTIKSKR